MKRRSLTYGMALCLVSLNVASSIVAQSIWNGGASGTHTWTDPSKWLPNTSAPNGIDAEAIFSTDLTAALTVNWVGNITLGSLTFGDTVTGFSGTTLGSAGNSLTFDVSTGNAILEWNNTTSTLRDSVYADLVLNDNLEVRLGGSGGIDLRGVISGSGDLIRRYSTTGAPTSIGSYLRIFGQNNTYTGQTIVEHGHLEITGSVLKNQDSALGNTDSAIILGNANTPVSMPDYANTASLRVRVLNDTENLEISRDIDFSKGAESASVANWRSVLYFIGDGTGGVNKNRLTLSGDLIVGAKTVGLTAERREMEIYVTGDIRTWFPASGPNQSVKNFMLNTVTGAPTSDGGVAGIIRFSDRARTYNITNSLTNGTIIIEGSVGVLDTPSPIGTKSISMSDGAGGNIITANGQHSLRSVFMATPDTEFKRELSMGTGNNTAPTGAGLTYYGSQVNVFNAFQIGGLNTSGVVTYSGAITSSNLNIGSNKQVTLGHNLALIAQEGGTVDFKGAISDSSSADYHTRITINQSRYHSQLDNNGDGVIDSLANTPIGTATTGTVRLYAANTYEGGTEVMGGTLLTRNETGSATGTGMILVNTGTRIGGLGKVSPGANALRLLEGATLAPGDPTVNGGIGKFSVQGNLELNTLGASILDFQILASNGINASTAANLIGSELNWSAITTGTMQTDKNDYLEVSGNLLVNTTGTTEVKISLQGAGILEAGMAWNLLDADNLSVSDASKYSFDFNGLDADLASRGLYFDTSHFAEYGILAVGNAVPEPARLMLGLVGLSFCLFRRRRV